MSIRFAAAALLALAVPRADAQQPAPPPIQTGWEYFGLPALNFDSDEGFGYGALLEMYNYGTGAKQYRFMIRPLLLFTTKGRRDFTIFFDAPRLLPTGWRLDAFVGREQHLATPYYGIGNTTVNDEALSDPPDDYFYRYGRTQIRLSANVQREVARSARLLLGAGFADVETDPSPFDSGTTLLLQQLSQQQGVVNVLSPSGKIALVRAGAVLDTRDREIGPRSGHWVDMLVQQVHERPDFANSVNYTRVTATARKYISFGDRVVFAQRIAAQQTSGQVPLFDMSTFQTATGQSEALGGAGSVRGVSKNRFIGKGVAFSNSELRFRFHEFSLLKKPAYLVLSGFLDAGRVWDKNIDVGELFTDLHAGYGGGFRLGLGPSFLVAFDLGKSSESTQIYIGLGYPF